MSHEQQRNGKLDEWASAGLLTQAQVLAIRDYEAQKDGAERKPWGLFIFAGLGAVILGLGVILLFAYNWEAMPKAAKLGLIFGALVLAHGSAIAVRRKAGWGGLAEGLQLLGTMLFGAGMALVGQVYHLSEHYPTMFLVWAIGAGLLAWVLPSVGQGILMAVLLSVWSCSERASFDAAMGWAPLIVLGACGGLAWRLRSPVLLAVSVAAFVVTEVMGCDHWGFGWVDLSVMGLLLASLAASFRGLAQFPAFSAIFRASGLVLLLPMLFLLSFSGITSNLFHDSFAKDAGAFWGIGILGVSALGLAFFSAYRAAVAGAMAAWARDVAPPLLFSAVLIFFWAVAYASNEGSLGALPILASLLFVAFAMDWIWRGCRDGRIAPVVNGSLLFSAWVFARFADWFEDLLVRGVIFVLMGVALFGVAVLYHRMKKRRVGHAAMPATERED